MLEWASIQQFVRIGLYTAGGYVFGDGVADGELFQQALGGALAVLSFAWWWFWERNRIAALPKA